MAVRQAKPTKAWIAARMREVAEAAELSQRELAKRTGVSEPCISRWFGATETPTSPNPVNLQKFCKACGITVADFWAPLDNGAAAA